MCFLLKIIWIIVLPKFLLRIKTFSIAEKYIVKEKPIPLNYLNS